MSNSSLLKIREFTSFLKRFGVGLNIRGMEGEAGFGFGRGETASFGE